MISSSYNGLEWGKDKIRTHNFRHAIFFDDNYNPRLLVSSDYIRFVVQSVRH